MFLTLPQSHTFSPEHWLLALGSRQPRRFTAALSLQRLSPRSPFVLVLVLLRGVSLWLRERDESGVLALAG